MSVKVAINGFGRIGRNVMRIACGSNEMEIVAINDLTDAKTLAHLFKYDSVHGTFNGEVGVDGDNLVIDGKKVQILSQRDPAQLPWKDLGVEIVIESTGLFTARDKAAMHLEAGAKKVVISAPGTNSDITVCMGINEEQYDPASHDIISNASCTTNCLAPVAKVLLQKFGIVRGMMTTIHAYTNDQSILDLPHKDLRRARAAAVSMIPTTTGAAKAVVETDKTSTIAEINAAMKEASEGEMKGILDYTDLPLVSKDFNGSSASSSFDALTTNVIGGNMVKVLTWYDKEWGYSNRVFDLVRYIDQK